MRPTPKPPALNPTPDRSPAGTDTTALWKRVELNLTDLTTRLTALENGGGSGSGDPYPGPMAPVEAEGSSGASADFARGDHAHEGLHSVAALVNGASAPQITGDAVIAADPGGTVRQVGNIIYVGADGSGGGGGGMNCPLFETVAVASDTDLTSCDCIVLADAGSLAGVAVNLPPSADGLFFCVKKVDPTAGFVQIVPQSGQLIDGAEVLTWSVPGQSYAVVGDGSNWWIVWGYNPMTSNANTPNVTLTGANGQQPSVQTSGGVPSLATTDVYNRRLLERILLTLERIEARLGGEGEA